MPYFLESKKIQAKNKLTTMNLKMYRKLFKNIV